MSIQIPVPPLPITSNPFISKDYRWDRCILNVFFKLIPQPKLVSIGRGLLVINRNNKRPNQATEMLVVRFYRHWARWDRFIHINSRNKIIGVGLTFLENHHG